MEKFYLPKGTIVKHGTSLCRLKHILSDGIIPYSDRNGKRIQSELSPEIQGVYVGGLIAYFGAVVSYTSILNPYTKSNSFLSALACMAENPKNIKQLKLEEIPITLPVVLNIELKEDCLIYADEDYVLEGSCPVDKIVPEELLISEAEKIWNEWKSGCVVREEGIPQSWITDIEFPRISNLNGDTNLHRETWGDVELMAAATMQSSLRDSPDDLMKAFEKTYRRKTLSQKVNASHNDLDGIYKMKGLSDIFNVYFNHVVYIMTFENMAQQYGIPLHR